MGAMNTPLPWTRRRGSADEWGRDAEREAHLALSADCIAALDAWTVLRVSGADRDAFLQGQLTADLRDLTPERTLVAACCNPQGRVLATMRLSRRADHTLLRLHSSVAAAIATRLGRFVLRADAHIADAGEALPALGLWGPGAVRLLLHAGLPAPGAAEACATQGDVQVIRQPGLMPRFELRGPPEAIADRWNALSAHAAAVGGNAWRLLDILAGNPDIRPATSGHFVAQSLNLDTSGALQFDKGCYTGQEVIARLHYRGRAARRMYLLHGNRPPPAPGDPVHHAGETAPVGEVVDAVEDGKGSCAIAAVLRVACAGAGLHLPAAAEAPLSPPTLFTYGRNDAPSA